ncbi:MAG: pyridoxamine 5'-phosphate oxidase family protein [Micrococcaceae bacterium]
MSEQALNRETVLDVMRSERFVMLSTATREGKIVSHPMAPQQVTDEAEVWFIIGRESDQSQAIRANPQVNLAFAEAGSWLSLAGTAEFVDDQAKIDELWTEQAGAYFEQGRQDPNVTLLKVTGDSAQFWGVPGGAVGTTLKLIGAKITGKKPDGASGTVEL